MRKALAGVAMICLAIMWPRAALADGGVKVFPPDSKPYGMTYPAWTAAYQEWIEEIPTPENPLANPDSPRNCKVRGPVAYIGASGTGHGCTVPEGKGLLLSTAFWECSTAEGLGDTFAELRRCAKENFRHDLGHDAVRIQLSIDGEPISHSRAWTFLGPAQIIEFPDDNIWGAPGGPTKSVTKGFLYVVAPLDAGEHLILAHVTLSDGTKFRTRYPVNVES